MEGNETGRKLADAEAIESVYRSQFSQFAKAMEAIVGNPDDAREAVQEGFARALSASQGYRGEGSLPGWIWRIALNAARDKRRRIQETPFESVFPLELPEPVVDRGLADALKQLPKRQRLVLVLHYIADLSYSEIAGICGITEGAVGASLSKARHTLAVLLADSQGSEQISIDERSRYG